MRTQKYQVHVHRAVAGEYVRAGCTYDVTAPKTTGGHYHFHDPATGNGTFMTEWVFHEALHGGAIEKLYESHA